MLSTAWNRHAIAQTQLRKARRVDGVGRPKLDFHTGPGEAQDRLLQRAQRADVQVVRGLVEDEDVAALPHDRRQLRAVPLAAGQVLDLLRLFAPVWKSKFYGAFDTCSMAWRCRFLGARPSKAGRFIVER